MVMLAKSTQDKALLFALVSIYQNISNSNPKKELTDEQKSLLKLKKYAKEHVNEDHLLDGKEYVDGRIKKLVDCNIIDALVLISKKMSNSPATREAVARILVSISNYPEYRGRMVACGAHLPLLSVANEADPEVMNVATQVCIYIYMNMCVCKV